MGEGEEGEKKKVSSWSVHSRQRKKRIGKKAYLRQKPKLKMAEVEESPVMDTPATHLLLFSFLSFSHTPSIS